MFPTQWTILAIRHNEANARLFFVGLSIPRKPTIDFEHIFPNFTSFQILLSSNFNVYQSFQSLEIE